jgi:hypothetical protein
MRPARLDKKTEESCALSFGFPKTDHLTAAGYRQFACMLGSNNPGCDKDLFQQCLDENQGIAIYEE